MAVFTKRAIDIFAAQDSSGAKRNVANHDAQVWGTEIERALAAFQAGGGVIFQSKAEADVALDYAANTMAWVFDDNPTLAGIYQKQGAAGSGSWLRVGDLPYSFILAQNTGAGTANAIQAATAVPIPAADGGALIALNIVADNTSSPVTVSFNGGAHLTIKTIAGNDTLSTGALAAGMIVWGFKQGSDFRLVTDLSSAAIQAAAEAAAQDAEDAADRAQSYAAMLSADKVKFDTVAALLADSTLSYTPGSGLIEVGEGDIIEAQGFRYEVVASGATDAHVETAGGVKLINISPAADRFLPSHQVVPLSGPDVILGVVGGFLIGGSGSTIYRSKDGDTWTVIQDTGHSVGGTLGAIYELDNGEVLLNTSRTLVRSTGWASDPATATWTIVLTAGTYATGQSRFHQGWSVSVAGQYVLASEYGSPKPNAHRSYLSTDYGQTFITAFDQRDHFPIVSNSDAHLHGCCIDPYHGAVPRLWQLSADSGQIAWFYSDDLANNWTRLPDDAYPVVVNDASEPPNYVVVAAAPGGIVAGSDSKPDGVGYIPRDSKYNSAPQIKTVLAFGDNQLSLTHVAQSHAVLGDWVFILFNPSDPMVSGGETVVPARITATNSKSGETRIIWEGNPDQHSLSKIDYYQEALWVRSGSGSVINVPLYQTDTVYTQGGIARDSGNVLGGIAIQRFNSLVLHPSSKVGHETSLVLSQFSESTGPGQLIIAPFADVDGARVIALSPGLSAFNAPTQRIKVHGIQTIGIGYNAEVDGNSALGIGDRAIAVGDIATAIGREASALQPSSIAIGFQSEADGTYAVAIGREAKATNISALAIGHLAEASGFQSVAIGNSAVASHSNSVALQGATTTASNQVHIGQRFVQAAAFTSNRATPPTGQVAEWWHDTGSGLEKRFRTPDGTVMKFTVEAV